MCLEKLGVRPRVQVGKLTDSAPPQPVERVRRRRATGSGGGTRCGLGGPLGSNRRHFVAIGYCRQRDRRGRSDTSGAYSMGFGAARLRRPGACSPGACGAVAVRVWTRSGGAGRPTGDRARRRATPRRAAPKSSVTTVPPDGIPHLPRIRLYFALPRANRTQRDNRRIVISHFLSYGTPVTYCTLVYS